VIASSTTLFEFLAASPLRWSVRILSVLVLAALLTVLLRVGPAHGPRTRSTLPGALLIALLWHLLQTLGTLYVTLILAEASTLNQTFGVVLGLMGLLFLASVMAMLGVELNVVLERRLWPRALLTPFTDAVELTEADRRAYASYARAQRHKGFETVTVDFDRRDEDDQPQRPGG